MKEATAMLRAKASASVSAPGEKGVSSRIMLEMLETYGRLIAGEIDRGSDKTAIVAGFLRANQYVSASAIFTIAGMDPNPDAVRAATMVYIEGFRRGLQRIVDQRLAGDLKAFTFGESGVTEV